MSRYSIWSPGLQSGTHRISLLSLGSWEGDMFEGPLCTDTWSSMELIHWVLWNTHRFKLDKENSLLNSTHFIMTKQYMIHNMYYGSYDWSTSNFRTVDTWDFLQLPFEYCVHYKLKLLKNWHYWLFLYPFNNSWIRPHHYYHSFFTDESRQSQITAPSHQWNDR